MNNDDVKNKLKSLVRSRYFTISLIVLAEIILLLAAFGMGMAVGFRKANFSYQWGENYDRNFGGPRHGFMRGFGGDESFGRDYMNAHGVSGSIMKIDDDSLIVKGNDNVEKTVIISDGTALRKQRENIKIADLKVDDLVTIIGDANDSGQIEAKFIRVFDNK